jgi:hypothetical protein
VTVSDASDPHNGEYKFTLGINYRTSYYNNKAYTSPMLDKIQYIKDELNGQFEYCGDITVTAYEDESKTRQIKLPVTVDSSRATQTDNGYQWELTRDDLKEIIGPYYYEVVYYVKAADDQVVDLIGNTATVGVAGLNGKIGPHKASLLDGSPQYAVNFSKRYVTGAASGRVQWEATLKSYIAKNSVYYDYFDTGGTTFYYDKKDGRYQDYSEWCRTETRGGQCNYRSGGRCTICSDLHTGF